MILGLASYRLDALVLALLKDSYAVGIYGLAYRFMEAAIPIGAFITFAIFPLLVRDEPDRERRALQVARAPTCCSSSASRVAVGDGRARARPRARARWRRPTRASVVAAAHPRPVTAVHVRRE